MHNGKVREEILVLLRLAIMIREQFYMYMCILYTCIYVRMYTVCNMCAVYCM